MVMPAELNLRNASTCWVWHTSIIYSSSGILEAPSLKVPTIDVGARQRGRVRPESVIHCEPEADSIRAALDVARSPGFQARVRKMVPPFGDGDTSRRIAAVLRDYPLEGILFKQFVEVP